MSNLFPQAQSQRSQGRPIRLSFAGNPWRLSGLCFLNILLIVITIGIYWFWARTEYRRYMWQMVRINDEPLEYTGKGKELLIGYLKLFAFVILPSVVLIGGVQLAFGPKHPLAFTSVAFVYIAIFCLYFAGIFRANRYILSRTRWRGIAFSLGSGAAGYAWTSIWSALLSGPTLGWLWPWRLMALRRRLTNAMSFGSMPFSFEGRAGALYGPFAFMWLAFVLFYGGVIALQVKLMALKAQHPAEKMPLHWDSIPPLALLAIFAAIPVAVIGYSWFEARKLNVFAEATRVGGLKMHLEAGGGSVFWLTLSNMLILVFSVGILRPVTQARRLRYLVTRLSISGLADLDEVHPGLEREGTQGAGLEAAFSIEIF